MNHSLSRARGPRLVAGLLAAALLVAACGGGDDDDAKVKEGGEKSTSKAGLVTSVEDASTAVVQIVAKGTFRDPEVGVIPNAAGAGTGFIIDPSGLVVTNNHVVTGAATLEVFVEGQEDSLNAKVVGVSECNDLALIDIEGDGFPFVEFYEDEPKPGLEVNLAGFPLGDPEYTLTRGVVAKAKADGDVPWASLDFTLQHDAAGEPGNSGGPILTEDAKVVGVHYASGAAPAGSQFFAIPAEIASDVAGQLKDGDVESIGVNGQAVADEEQGIFGIWVSSVQSGTPADKAGVEAGDIITKIEDLVLSTDGTMADYCDILRTRDEGDVMSIEVLRFDTEEILRGQLNSDEVLEQAFSFAQELEEEAPSGGAAYSEYVGVTDDSGSLQVEVPAEWADVDGSAQDLGGGPQQSIQAAPDLDAFLNGFDTPGLFFTVGTAGPEAIDPTLDAFASGLTDCTSAGRTDYADALYAGKYEVFDSCGGTGTQVLALAVSPEDGSYVALVLVQLVTSADGDALDRILATFQKV